MNLRQYKYNILFYILSLPLGGVGGGFFLVVGGGFLSSCSQEVLTSGRVADSDSILVTMDMEPFAGEGSTRTSVTGEAFETGEKIRFKVICPHSQSHENGETWGSSFHEITVPSGNATAFVTGTIGAYESQATTYVYSAQNTTGTRVFVVGDWRYSRPSNFFYADQSKLEHFKKSDVVWAQAIRQTGAREVHLNFKHKVAKLDLTIDDGGLLSDNAILTLEGMPDIDGAEIVVGDYYADESYEEYSYNYKQKASCGYENNGKVIGIEVIDEEKKRSVVYGMTGNPSPAGGNSNGTVWGTVKNEGTYTAYQDPDNKKHYLLYVPACNLNPNGEGKHATFWLRDGERRYSIPLELTEFKEGMWYEQKVAITPYVADKSQWTVAGVSSEYQTSPATNAFDGKSTTNWMSGWVPYNAATGTSAHYQEPPHWIAIDMNKNTYVSAITYLPRQDYYSPRGNVVGYKVYLSETLPASEADWGEPVKEGEFSYVIDVHESGWENYNDWGERVIKLDSPVKVRYMKFEVTSVHDGLPSETGSGSYVYVAEIGAQIIGVE